MNFGEYGKLTPITAKEVSEVETIQGKRKRINDFSHYDPLVRAVFNSAYAQGLSGEDTMTLLAYAALIEYERMREIALEAASINPRPVVITTTAT